MRFIAIALFALLISTSVYAAAVAVTDTPVLVSDNFVINVTVAKYAEITFTPDSGTMNLVPDSAWPQNNTIPSAALKVATNADITVNLMQDLGAALNDSANGGMPYTAMWKYPGNSGAGTDYIVSPNLELRAQTPPGGANYGTRTTLANLPAGTPYAGEPSLGVVVDFGPGTNNVQSGTPIGIAPNLYTPVMCGWNTSNVVTGASWTQVKPGNFTAHVYATVQAK